MPATVFCQQEWSTESFHRPHSSCLCTVAFLRPSFSHGSDEGEVAEVTKLESVSAAGNVRRYFIGAAAECDIRAYGFSVLRRSNACVAIITVKCDVVAVFIETVSVFVLKAEGGGCAIIGDERRQFFVNKSGAPSLFTVPILLVFVRSPF